jgi:hypothetical protein
VVTVGIRECEVIQWFVEPEARVEQFDKLCEVQSDKASVEVGLFWSWMTGYLAMLIDACNLADYVEV